MCSWTATQIAQKKLKLEKAVMKKYHRQKIKIGKLKKYINRKCNLNFEITPIVNTCTKFQLFLRRKQSIFNRTNNLFNNIFISIRIILL